MLYHGKEMEQKAVLEAASLLCAAARTAPKARGVDNIVTLALTGEDLCLLADKMEEIANRDPANIFFARDAGNVRASQAVVLIGAKRSFCGLSHCSLCGFENCAACKAAGANCAFTTLNMGIALGSAAAMAADLRMDNRIMFTIGKAAGEMGYTEDEDVIWHGIPLCVSGKSVFFDRKPKV